MKKEFQTKHKGFKKIIEPLLIILICLGINLYVGYLSGWSQLGTLLAAFIEGPIVAIPVGFLSPILDIGSRSIATSEPRLIMAGGGVLIALVSGFLVKHGWAKNIWKPLLIFVFVLGIFSFSSFLHSMDYLRIAEGITWLNAIFSWFMADPVSYLRLWIDNTMNIVIPVFISVYVAWLIPKIATLRFEFRYKDKYGILDTAHLGSELATYPVVGKIFGGAVRRLAMLYMSLQKEEKEKTVKVSEIRGDYVFNQERGYGFRLPEIASEWSKVQVQLIMGSIQYNTTNVDIFNLDTVAKELNLDKEEVKKRVKRMLDEHLILNTFDASLQAYGYFLCYAAIKLKPKTSKEKKAEISKWLEENDYICTGYETEGDYDFYIGVHIPTIDGFNEKVMKKLYTTPEIEEIKCLPVMRLIRQERIWHWDAERSKWREPIYAPNEFEKLAQIQNKLDKTDLEIIKLLNKKKDIKDQYNINFFSKNIEKTQKILERLYEKRMLVSPIFLNWMKLNYTPHFILVKLNDKLSTAEKIEIANKIAENPIFNLVFQHNDSYFDLSLCVYKNIVDMKTLKDELSKIREIKEIKEMDATKQYRMWTLMLNDKEWGECRMKWD